MPGNESDTLALVIQRCIHELRNAATLDALADQVPENACKLRAEAQQKRERVIRVLTKMEERLQHAA